MDNSTKFYKGGEFNVKGEACVNCKKPEPQPQSALEEFVTEHPIATVALAATAVCALTIEIIARGVQLGNLRTIISLYTGK